MRALALSLLLLGLASVAAAQKVSAPRPAAGGTPQAPPAQPADATDWVKQFAGGPTPLWIWGADQNKKYFLRTEFAGAAARVAKVKVSADNHVVLFLNGKQAAACDEWQEGAEADVTKLLKAGGKNELVAEVWNDDGPAGFVMKLVMVPEKGDAKYVVSDESWTAAEKKDAAGAKATKVGAYGDQPWGKVFADTPLAVQAGGKQPGGAFATLPGFKVEKVFTVPNPKGEGAMGSWVSLTADDKGRLIASDEGKNGIFRITPGKVGTDEAAKVEKIPAKITAAQGLLWHKDALYVVCNGGPGSGLYRVTSSKKDDQLDTVEKLKAIQGSGEHGPHAIRLAPDGKSLYVVCGNHTKPVEFEHSRVPKNWAEDHLLPRQWDARGHAAGILAPGGYVARTDFDGKKWEIFTTGYRNAYDFAFNADGEMFVYDSDMEWDMGMPWYRPTRVSHATSGSEFGWRSGSGVWPSYYIDSLPAMIDIGPGSPVGVEFGYGAKFPAAYQNALFICDWTFGTMYALHITTKDSTYSATKEEFLSRTPLPLTDVVINQVDGAMYFTVGGRGAQSELYRVTYVGKDSTEKVEYGNARNNKDKRDVRRLLESLHSPSENPEAAVATALPYLGHADRFVRYAARVALEHQPVKFWQEKVLAEKNHVALINGVVGLAHQGDKSLKPRLLDALNGLSQRAWEFPREESDLLDYFRAYQLVFTRMGEPDKDAAAKLLKFLDGFFPGPPDPRFATLQREVVQLLVYLKSPTVVEKVCAELAKPSKPLSPEGLAELIRRNGRYGQPIADLIKNSADQQKLAYLFALRNATVGWNLERWKTYYAFLAEARTKSGGASYQGFLTNIETEAFANASDIDRLAIEAGGMRPAYKPKALPKPLGPGKEWTTADVVALEPKVAKGRDFKAGERAFAAARCVVCHRFGSDGGATGPDLTQVAGRFGVKELAESLVEPSKVVSDQYKASVVRTSDEKTYTGRVVGDADGKYTIVTDPEDSSKTVVVKKSDVVDLKPSNVSLMPDKLLNSLNESEVLDMLAYMLSRGDPNHAMFKK